MATTSPNAAASSWIDKQSANLRLSPAELKEMWSNSTELGGERFQATALACIFCRQPGSESLAFSFAGKFRPKLESARGFAVKLSEADGRTEIVIENSSTQNVDLFAQLGLDLLELSASLEPRNSQEGCRRILERLRAWRNFMKSSSRRLTAQQEIGLAGEIAFLTEYLRNGGKFDSLTAFWSGPCRGMRDFSFANETWVEVKTSSQRLPLRAKIDSLSQLNVECGQAVFLCTPLLDVEAKSDSQKLIGSSSRETFLTLPEMADAAQALLPERSLEEFRSLLIAAGLTDEQRDACTRRFAVVGFRFFRAESLPRLTPGCVPGIMEARYEIEICDASGQLAPKAQELSVNEAWRLLTERGGSVQTDDLLDLFETGAD